MASRWVRTFAPPPGWSAGHQLLGGNLPAFDRNDHALQEAFGVRAARIDGHGTADLPGCPRFVDMPVQGQDRLDALDELAHRRAADWGERRLAAGHLDFHVAGHRVGHVESGSGWRVVEVEDRWLVRVELTCEGVEPGAELGVADLAGTVPWGCRCPAEADDLVSVQVDELVLGVSNPVPLGKY